MCGRIYSKFVKMNRTCRNISLQPSVPVSEQNWSFEVTFSQAKQTFEIVFTNLPIKKAIFEINFRNFTCKTLDSNAVSSTKYQMVEQRERDPPMYLSTICLGLAQFAQVRTWQMDGSLVRRSLPIYTSQS